MYGYYGYYSGPIKNFFLAGHYPRVGAWIGRQKQQNKELEVWAELWLRLKILPVSSFFALAAVIFELD